MARIKDVGCAKLWFKEDNSCFAVGLEHYDALKAAWMKGEAFFTGTDLYGQPVTVKLGQIELLTRCTPESVAEYDREKAEEDAEQAIKGGD